MTNKPAFNLLCYNVFVLLVNVCFCRVRFTVFSTKTRDWLGRTSSEMTYFMLNERPVVSLCTYGCVDAAADDCSPVVQSADAAGQCSPDVTCIL